MKVIIASDKAPTETELKVIQEAAKIIKEAGLELELIGTRPNDR